MMEYDWLTSDISDVIKVACDKRIKKLDEKDDREKIIPMNVAIKNIQPSKRKFDVKIVTSMHLKDSSIEWKMKLKDEYSLSEEKKEVNYEFELDGNKSRDLGLEIDTPIGGYEGDELDVHLSIKSEDGINSYEKSFKVVLVPVIKIAKCTIGKELDIAIDLSNHAERDREERKARNQNAENEVMAIMSPYEIKGYFFIETMHADRVEVLSKTIRGFKGFVTGDIDISEIEKYLTPKPAVTGLEMGSLIEIVEGPFKGERAKITAIDAAKEEVTVQLIESMVPIPVTVKAEAIRNLDKA
ncbi:transcription elongation factor Spt5 [Ferroplasma sp.]|uniref:transcription elongation factor Spt5 n=1 Tax=Ferroplasma sp. TaxID=2591003 RepID=UPI0026112819|nr:transcription elongation factor Spt5 [Ferroplasma sp.]MCL4452963.1 transcription elongation factor Spt5 [Candidatus Thermoplasmatota archaeon]